MAPKSTAYYAVLHRHSYGEQIGLGEKSTMCHILSEAQRLQNALQSLYASRSLSYSELITFHTSCTPPSIRLRSLGMVLSLQGNVGPIQSFFISFLYCSDTGETPQTYSVRFRIIRRQFCTGLFQQTALWRQGHPLPQTGRSLANYSLEKGEFSLKIFFRQEKMTGPIQSTFHSFCSEVHENSLQ